jgi:hypothetical protein
LLKPEEAAAYQNRQVDLVIEAETVNPLYGKTKSWRGDLAEEYFIVMFVNGHLIISVSEREMQLGSKTQTYAMSDFLSKSLAMIDPNDTTGRQTVQIGYNKNISDKEQDQVTFQDVMLALNWRLGPKAKVDRDLLTE